MKSPIRPTVLAIAAIFLIAVVGSCSSSKNEDTEQPTATKSAPSETVAPTTMPTVIPTARPTVTPVPPPTSTPGPTPTPEPTATSTPVPTATPMPPAPRSHVLEMGRLQAEKGIGFDTQSISLVGTAEWDSAALGCPNPGVFYNTSAAPYTGTVYVITNGTDFWEYHSNHDDSVVRRCSEIDPLTDPTVNISQSAGLHDATKLTLMRRDSDTGNFVVRREMSLVDATLLANILDLDTNLPPAQTCNTIFRLDFETPKGDVEIEFICEDNYKAFDVFWNGMQGTAAVIGNIIGPYLTGDPIPSLPTATP